MELPGPVAWTTMLVRKRADGSCRPVNSSTVPELPGTRVGTGVVGEGQRIELRRVRGQGLLDRVAVDRVVAGRIDTRGLRGEADAGWTAPTLDAPALCIAHALGAGMGGPARKISGREVSVYYEVGRGGLTVQ